MDEELIGLGWVKTRGEWRKEGNRFVVFPNGRLALTNGGVYCTIDTYENPWFAALIAEDLQTVLDARASYERLVAAS